MTHITKSLLTGSETHPDFYSFVRIEKKTNIESKGISIVSCKVNRYGLIPFVSSGLSLARGTVAIVYSIFHLVMSQVESKKEKMHLKEAELGGKNIIRAAGEFFPVIGNLAILCFDLILRGNFYERKIKKELEDHPNLYWNQVTYFANDKKMGSLPIEDFRKQCKEKGDNLSDAEKIKIIMKKA